MRLYEYNLARRGLLLQIDSQFGEIAPLPGFSKETLEEARTETIEWMKTKKSPTLPSVKWGIECAQKPLQSVHLPLSALGPKEGFSTVKLKLGHLSIQEAIHFVQKFVGKFHLRLDCNKAWSLAEALTFTSHFKPTDFEYMEEPVQSFEELIEFSKATQFPIALDESIGSNWNAIPTLKAIVVKPMIVGGIPPIHASLQLILSSSYESGLGLLHIANRSSNPLPLGLDTYQTPDLLHTPITCAKGVFSWQKSSPLLDLSKLTEIFRFS